MKLKEMAKVKTGLVTARKEAREPFDKVMQYRQLNLRAIHAEGYIDGEYLEDFFAKEPLREEYLTRCGDVVIGTVKPRSYADLDIEMIALTQQKRIAQKIISCLCFL